jgi:hypothetical protein
MKRNDRLNISVVIGHKNYKSEIANSAMSGLESISGHKAFTVLLAIRWRLRVCVCGLGLRI